MVYFDRPVTDDEMRFLHAVMKRAAASADVATDAADMTLPAALLDEDPDGRTH